MDYKMLVNKNNLLDEHFKVDNLVKTDSLYKDDIYLEKEAFKAFTLLKNDALKYGHHFDIMSGYRTREYQKKLFDELVLEKGYNYASSYIALPGSSEHETGLAIDVAVYIKDKTYIEHDLENLDAVKWLQSNAHKYGFIIRYPKNKEEITKYNYEPWHIRYVGSISAYLYNNDLTLEEYHQKF